MTLNIFLILSTLIFLKTHAKESITIQLEDGSEYQKALIQIEKWTQGGQKELNILEVKKMNWVGKVASMNYTCSVFPKESCKNILIESLKDDALLVRDHALRITLEQHFFNNEEKIKITQEIENDVRNYRRGIGLWIVDRAKKFAQ